MISLSDKDFLRYDRQISIKGFDIEGQTRLKGSSALVIGLGGLGCSACQYLGLAGIGKLTLVDFDIVAESNLHRQVLHNQQQLKRPKVDSASLSLKSINPDIELVTIGSLLSEGRLSEQIATHDIVLDCCDNLPTKRQLNQICFKQKTPLVSAAAIRMEGLLTTFTYQANNPCYYCLSHQFNNAPLSCIESGVMSPLVGIIGSIQAMEVIKVLTDFGQPMIGRLLTIDAHIMAFNEIQFNKLAQCPICSDDQSHNL